MTCANENSERIVRFDGLEYPLEGSPPGLQAEAPDFLVSQWNDYCKIEVDLQNLLNDGRPILLTTSHTVDAPGSVLQLLNLEFMLRKFDRKVLSFHVSSDLPFTQNRFFREHNIKNIIAGSDYRYGSFVDYGVMLRDERVLCRSAFIIDQEGVVQYVEILKQLSDELNYNAIERQLIEACTAACRAGDAVNLDPESESVAPESPENRSFDE